MRELSTSPTTEITGRQWGVIWVPRRLVNLLLSDLLMSTLGPLGHRLTCPGALARCPNEFPESGHAPPCQCENSFPRLLVFSLENSPGCRHALPCMEASMCPPSSTGNPNCQPIRVAVWKVLRMMLKGSILLIPLSSWAHEV